MKFTKVNIGPSNHTGSTEYAKRLAFPHMARPVIKE